MSDAAASARIRLDVDDKNLGPQLSGAESAVSGWAGRVKGAIAAIGLGLLTKQVVDFGKNAVSAYNEQVDAEKKLNAVLESTEGAAGRSKDELVALAGELQTLTNVADDTIIKAQTLIATFTNISGDQFDRATRSAVDMGAILGGTEAAAMQLGKALNDPVAGITALSRAGVSFSESQKNAIKALAETGDIAKAQTLILNEVDKEFGGAADAGDNLGDRLASLSTRWGEVQESIGHTISVAATEAIPTLDKLMTGVEAATVPLSGLITALAETAAEMFSLTGAAGDFAATGEDIDAWATTFKTTLGGIPELIRSIDIGLIELAGDVAEGVGFSEQDVARMKKDAQKRAGADSLDEDVDKDLKRRARERRQREQAKEQAEAERKEKREAEIAARNEQTRAIMAEGAERARELKSKEAEEKAAIERDKEIKKQAADAEKAAKKEQDDKKKAEEQSNRDAEQREADAKAARLKKAADLQRSLGKVGIEDLNDAISSARINNFAKSTGEQTISPADQQAAAGVFAGIQARQNALMFKGRNAKFAPENGSGTQSPGLVNVDVKQTDVVAAVKALQTALVAKLGTAVLSK